MAANICSRVCTGQFFKKGECIGREGLLVILYRRVGIAADGFIVQTGDPRGPAEGFVDPGTGKLRTIPLEIMVEGDKAPIYGATLEVLSSQFIFYRRMKMCKHGIRQKNFWMVVLLR